MNDHEKMFCGLFSRPTGSVYLIKSRIVGDTYSLEYHEDDDRLFTTPADSIIAKTRPMKSSSYAKIATQLRGRGYDLPFIHTRDLNMLVDDFWAAVAFSEKSYKQG